MWILRGRLFLSRVLPVEVFLRRKEHKMKSPSKWSSTTQRIIQISLTGALLAASGCAELTPNFQNQKEKEEQVTGIDIHSAFPAIRRIEFEQVNLVELIDPTMKAKERYPEAWADAERQKSFGLRYDLVLAAFREDNQTTEYAKRAHRDAVQDRILSVSTSRCNVFKSYLRRQQSSANFWLGSMTTVAGVLGAILPGARATQNLAGAAGLFSGIQAQYNSDFFSNTAAALIAKGIDTHQRGLYARLLEWRKGKGVSAYSMEAAIRDALYFDGTCSAVVGLQEANVSLEEQLNPGIPRAAQVIAAVRAMNEIASAPDFTELTRSGQLGRLIKVTQVGDGELAAGLSGDESNPAAAVQSRVSEAFMAVDALHSYVDQKSRGLVNAFQKAQASRKFSDPEPDLSVAKDAQDAFAQKMKEALKLKDEFGLNTCVASLKVPTEVLYDKLGKQALEVKGTDARMKADAAVDAAVVQLESALAAMEWHRAKARAYVDEMANPWEKSLTKVPLDKSSIEAITKLDVKAQDPPPSRCVKSTAVAAGVGQ
jgi:hypothetical protein